MDLTQPILTSVQEAFSTMLASTVAHVGTSGPGDLPTHSGLTAFVGFGGKSRGALVIQLNKTLAGTVTGTMLGPDLAADAASVRDAVGELANVVAGGFKQALSSTESLFDLSVPAVVEGEGHQVASRGSGPWTLLRFTAGTEAFLVAARLEA